MSWRARKGLLPNSATNASSSGRGSPRRFVWAGVLMAVVRCGSASRMQLRRAEEVGDLDRSGFRRVGSMYNILLDAERVVRPDGSRGGFLRIRGAHDLTVLRN